MFGCRFWCTRERRQSTAKAERLTFDTPGAMFAGSSTPLQDDQGNLALVQVLEKVAAGRGEETGMTTPEAVAQISLRMFKVLEEKQEFDFKALGEKQEFDFKVLGEKQEIERTIAKMEKSHMQAELSKMAEILRSCEDENLDQLKHDLETLRSQVTVWGWVERTHGLKQDYRSPYDRVDTKRLQIAFNDYLRDVKKYGDCLYRLWEKTKGKAFRRIEALQQLLENFRIPEAAHAAFKSAKLQHLIWEHWVSSVMFNGFEDPLFGESSHEQFRARKYVEVFPRWLFLELGGRSQDDRSKKFEEDMKFRQLYWAMVHHVRFLHELASAPVCVPATLMRGRLGTVLDETDNSWAEIASDSQRGGERVVQVVLTPGFRVGSEVIAKCRVLCSEHQSS